MVVQVGGYYRQTFRGERGITQVNPLSPTIFNVVVDAVFCYWVSLVAEREGGGSSDDDRDAAKTAVRKIR